LRDVYVIGCGMTVFGRAEGGLLDILQAAALAAMDDAAPDQQVGECFHRQYGSGHPQPYERCGKTDFETGGFEGPAILLTFTRVHALSLAYTDRYITLGIVEFADGTRALGRLDVDEPEIGMKLKTGAGVVRTDGLTETECLRLSKA
jgi:hypothetical protein